MQWKNELIKIDGERLSVCIVIVFLILSKLYFINAFHFFWCFLFWVRSWAFHNHFPDLWKLLMNVSRFSFQVRNSKKKWKAFNRKQHCDKEKKPPIYEPIEFLKFCSQHGALFKFRVGLHDLFSPFWRSNFT